MKYRSMCPHCGTKFSQPLDPAVVEEQPPVTLGASRRPFILSYLGREVATKEGRFIIMAYKCMKCSKVCVDVVHKNLKAHLKKANAFPTDDKNLVSEKLIPIIPFGKERPVPDEVPSQIADDYKEATKISNISLKGASTLVRRALQATLRNIYPDMPNGDLVDEIKWVAKHKPDIPEDIIKALHTLRKAGNFGAHPPENGLTPVYEISEEDLETCFMILDILFDEYYVKPVQIKAKIDTLHKRVFPSSKSKKPEQGKK